MPIAQERVFALLGEIEKLRTRLALIHELASGEPSSVCLQIMAQSAPLDVPAYHTERAHFMAAANRNARVALKRRAKKGSKTTRPLLGRTGLQSPERSVEQTIVEETITSESVAIKRAILNAELEYKQQQKAAKAAQDDLPEEDQKLYERIAKSHPEWNPVQIYEELKRRKERDAPITGGIF